jgi:hypothetical protein
MTRKWRPWVRKELKPQAITREQWRLSRSPGQMLSHLEATRGVYGTRTGQRKIRLFHLACCRRGRKLLERDPVRPVLEAAERHADGAYRRDRLVRLIARVRSEVRDSLPDGVCVCEESFYTRRMYEYLRRQVGYLRGGVLWSADPQPEYFPDAHYLTIAFGVAGLELARELSAQSALLRDIFGDPFRPPRFSPAWRTETAVLLAQQMYESRDFGAMPILADALQDADCNDAAILSHCRNRKQTHVRGCWVVDAVLGKE